MLLSRGEVDIALARFHEAVSSLGYKPVVVKRIVATFHALIKRSGLLPGEAQMIKGLSRRIRERAGK